MRVADASSAKGSAAPYSSTSGGGGRMGLGSLWLETGSADASVPRSASTAAPLQALRPVRHLRRRSVQRVHDAQALTARNRLRQFQHADSLRPRPPAGCESRLIRQAGFKRAGVLAPVTTVMRDLRTGPITWTVMPTRTLSPLLRELLQATRLARDLRSQRSCSPWIHVSRLPMWASRR